MTKNSRAANACKISVLLLFSSILLGCNFAPSYQQPQDVVAATVPDATPAPALAPAVLAAAQADALQWLADDRLRHTVALALHNNRDLRIAADNVAKARADNCARARLNKVQLAPGRLVAHTNAKGERSYMDDATREAELRRADDIIAADCQ